MSTGIEEASPYPAIRRIVTGHTAPGKSVFLEDKPIAGHKAADWNSEYIGLYRHDEFPASNQDTPKPGVEVPQFMDHVASKPTELFSSTGTTFWAVDSAPGSQSEFHRTVTVDYAIVMKGTITLVLDDGARIKASAGDVIIQRGTIHKWLNEGDEWTRAFFILIHMSLSAVSPNPPFYQVLIPTSSPHLAAKKVNTGDKDSDSEVL